jgi:Replication protein
VVPEAVTSGGVRAVREDRAAGERRRRKLREFWSYLTDHREQKGCGRTIRKGRVGSAAEILEVTTACRCKWLCPTCGHTASWQQARTLKDRIHGWTAAGGSLALLTLTQSHSLSDPLAVLWDRVEAGWAAVQRGSGWTADKKSYGVCGYVRITEVVHSPTTGWNVHLHVVLLLEAALDESPMEGLRASVAGRFVRGVTRGGGHALIERQDLRPMVVGTGSRLANYLFKGTTMRWGADGSRTPIAILSDLESTGEGFDLWNELTAAVSEKRRMQVRTSNQIDSLCLFGPPTTLDKTGNDSTNTSSEPFSPPPLHGQAHHGRRSPTTSGNRVTEARGASPQVPPCTPATPEHSRLQLNPWNHDGPPPPIGRGGR